mmetsp:Transcript_4858/g.9265  ORF Transcript_4858/g.9265 Transcript_4858/m.9265 type:complete len:269 (-) Transcript_4858:14-820(-)
MISLTNILVFTLPVIQAFTGTPHHTKSMPRTTPYPTWSTCTYTVRNTLARSSIQSMPRDEMELTSTSSDSSSSSSPSSSNVTRRSYISTIMGTAAMVTTTAAASFLSAPQRALAEVARGDSLPQGAEQFQRLLVLKSDLPAVIQRLSKAKAAAASESSTDDNTSDQTTIVVKIDDKEWDALSDFLRKLYKGGDDIKSYTKVGGASIISNDKEKKQKAEEDAKLLQKIAQAGDGPISKKDIDGLLLLLKKGDVVLQDFFELLRDIPDEL